MEEDFTLLALKQIIKRYNLPEENTDSFYKMVKGDNHDFSLLINIISSTREDYIDINKELYDVRPIDWIEVNFPIIRSIFAKLPSSLF